MNKLLRTLALAAVMLVPIVAFAQSGPADALQQINSYRASKNKDIKTRSDYDAVQAEVKKMAEGFLKGLDLKKVEAADGLAWAQIASMAEKHKLACDLCQKYLTSNPSSADRFTAHMLMLNSCNEQGEADMILMVSKDVSPDTKERSLTFATNTAYMYADTIKEKKGVDAAIKAIEAAEARIPVAQFATDQEKKMLGSARYSITDAKVSLLMDAGKKDRALETIDAGIKLFPDGDANAKRLSTKRNQITIINSLAPVLTVERGYGEFPGLDKLKGKVVLVDFFAHWCGPCIASFPEMKQLYADFHDKGLEIVGATRYYGYYGQERGLSPDAEFAKMQGFLDEHKLPWPVVYVKNEDFTAYGVTGIPHVAVIDKKGNVHKIKVGYSPSTFKAFRDEIEKLLK